MFDYRIGNASLTRCFTFKDLSVTFDAQFTFNEHVDIIVASSVKTLGFIFRSCKRFRSESCLRAPWSNLNWSTVQLYGRRSIEEVFMLWSRFRGSLPSTRNFCSS
jgi:hypothetical protein